VEGPVQGFGCVPTDGVCTVVPPGVGEVVVGSVVIVGKVGLVAAGKVVIEEEPVEEGFVQTGVGGLPGLTATAVPLETGTDGAPQPPEIVVLPPVDVLQGSQATTNGRRVPPDAVPLSWIEGGQVVQIGALDEGTVVMIGKRGVVVTTDVPGVQVEQPVSTSALGSCGASVGGQPSFRQWKIVVRRVFRRPSAGGSPMTGTPSVRIVMTSWLSRDSTTRTLWPWGSTHHLTTRHFWPGLPGSLTVMMRPVGSSGGLGVEGTAG